MPVTTTAAVVRAAGQPFVIEEVLLDGPRVGELRVRISAVGMCRTDLGSQAGHSPFALPAVLGHEGAGVVEEVGEGVAGFKAGDKVLLSFSFCGRCPACLSGVPARCESWLQLNMGDGHRPDGNPVLRGLDGRDLNGSYFGQSAFSTLAIVDAASAIVVPADAPLDVLAPLGCSVQTGVGTVLNTLRPGPGDTIAVFGAGAVGLSAIMGARLTAAETIIAVDRIPHRLALAQRLGATHVIDASAEDVSQALLDLTHGRGVTSAMDTTGSAAVLASALGAIAVGGVLALVGISANGESLPLDINSMILGRSIIGVTEGAAQPHTLVPALVGLHRQGRLPLEELIRTYPLSQIQVAADDMQAGRTIKPVLVAS